ncbi:MAG: hypothetical protein A2751_03425 [Candidatus Doudnabacteria bacterium RIFCSPHIGHO2_01_FULL_46_14]|uniref:Helix-turn-helix domain-containing protein n=1 Tax=Candidatus Doudnabacteria bacterium RIFCSPHIGHO2_01_FULL_46_14 TaxID=1817824 RepID=A0A1F5NKV9_9BACT|nr:MAG: hypothetical protein A2751_03425 [Candidatus Doudnabacteria bacterium RIFCSPHIGHO2_01_FULL_46_14]
MTNKEKIYGVTELSKFFAVSEKTIWDWCRKGRLPGFKIGKEWKVRISDLNRLIIGKVNAKTEKGKTLF